MLTLAVCLAVTCRAVTTVPTSVPDFAQTKGEVNARLYMQNDLSYAFGYHIHGRQTNPTTSLQHFELDTFLHTGADVPHVFTGILNVLAEGGSHAGRVSTGGAGADIRGTVDELDGVPCHTEVHDAGVVKVVKCYEASHNGDAIGQRLSFIDHDHRSVHPLARDDRRGRRRPVLQRMEPARERRQPRALGHARPVAHAPLGRRDAFGFQISNVVVAEHGVRSFLRLPRGQNRRVVAIVDLPQTRLVARRAPLRDLTAHHLPLLMTAATD